MVGIICVVEGEREDNWDLKSFVIRLRELSDFQKLWKEKLVISISWSHFNRFGLFGCVRDLFFFFFFLHTLAKALKFPQSIVREEDD